MTEQEQDYLRRIHELEQQVLRLQTELKKNSETQYGLRWMDVPEAFDEKAENAVPILEEVKEKAITSEDGKPTHILIEGDNYHALTCLNYTHKGAIDVIYIDPPYNTGSDGFIYKDKRVLDKFPDGTTVPTDHPLRHSYWLSFMHKRLQLAKNLLSKRGVIFISIDDNEQANLKLLCDQVFGEKNFVAKFDWRKKTGANDAKDIAIVTESILLYAKNKVQTLESNIWNRDDNSVNQKRYKLSDQYVTTRGKYYYDTLDRGGLQYSDSMNFGIEAPDGGMIFPNGRDTFKNDGWIWKWGKEKIQWGIENGFIEFIKSKKSKGSAYTIKYKVYQHVDNEGNIRERSGRAFMNLILDPINQQGNDEMKSIFDNNVPFSNPKPLRLISMLLKTIKTEQSTILDFFAGSGTTMHATMQLNEEDGGHRQCILVTNNENQICEKVTYERNRRVMQGYTNAKGEEIADLGNSLKYYRTAFVGNHDIAHINDADKVALTQKAGCLLALGENTLEEISTATTYQIFQLRQGDRPANGFEYTAIYFSGNLMHFADFRHEIEAIQQTNPLARIAVYVFTWGDPSIFENEFDDLTGITIKPIPQPILEIYQNIHKL